MTTTESEDRNAKIQKTANTLYDLLDHTDIPFVKDISDFLDKNYGEIGKDRISTPNFGALVVSRFLTNHSVLQMAAQKNGKDLQVIELGAGFTPHYLNIGTEINKYIEVEFEENSKIKEEVTKTLTQNTNIYFVGGDILSPVTWNKIENLIDKSKPVFIFSEGTIAQYFNSEQKEFVASMMKKLMTCEGSVFALDDTLRNHPELSDNPIIKEGMGRVVSISGNNIYNKEVTTFKDEFEKWGRLLGTENYSVNYVLSKPEMDFATESLKLTVCAVDNNKSLSLELAKLSNENKNKRIWK